MRSLKQLKSRMKKAPISGSHLDIGRAVSHTLLRLSIFYPANREIYREFMGNLYCINVT
jgi:hypothetical protein